MNDLIAFLLDLPQGRGEVPEVLEIGGGRPILPKEAFQQLELASEGQPGSDDAPNVVTLAQEEGDRGAQLLVQLLQVHGCHAHGGFDPLGTKWCLGLLAFRLRIVELISCHASPPRRGTICPVR